MAKDNVENASTTLSARFDPQELAALRQAADAKQWSLSQLIRAAAYEKAVNILNARSAGAYGVRRVLGELVEQMFKPKIMVAPDGPEQPTEFEPSQFGISYDMNLYPTTLSAESARKLGDAMTKLGAELAPMYYEEMLRMSAIETHFELLDPSLPSSSESRPAPAQPVPEPKQIPRNASSRRGQSNKGTIKKEN